MTDMEAGPSRVAPTAFEQWRRVEDLSRDRGEVSYVTTEHSVIDSVVGETIPAMETATVPRPPPTWDVPRAPKDPTLLANYSTHVASLI